MFLNRQKGNKKTIAKMKYDDYIGGHPVPPEHHGNDIAPEIEDELLSNRFFLKRRVWKNTHKIRRNKTVVEKPRRTTKNSIYGPRHLSV